MHNAATARTFGAFFSQDKQSELARPMLQFWAVQMRAFLAGCG
jgi:hypothetical protein